MLKTYFDYYCATGFQNLNYLVCSNCLNVVLQLVENCTSQDDH